VGGYLAGMIVAGVLLRHGWRAVPRALPATGPAVLAALVGGSCWLFCYFANNNYPYRSVLLLFAVPWWFGLAESSVPGPRALGRALCMLLLLALWLAAPFTWCSDLVQKHGASEAFAMRAAFFIAGAWQMFVFALSAVLAVALAAWTWRRWRELRSA
jgi:hypothetical protein